MNCEPLTPTDMRRHDLDWLRLIAIIILLFFHTGMWFNHWGWHVKNNELSYSFQYWMIWSHYFRMPLLLFISGAGTYMALGKRTPYQFRKERFRKLFIPLVFGMLVIVPPQIYYEHITQYANYWEFYKTVFHFVPYPKGSLSWHHLWFILYLFLYSLLALPLLVFLRSPRSERLKQKMYSLLSSPGGLLFIPSLTMLVSQIMLRPFFPEETHDLLKDWAYFAFYFLFFIMGIFCYSHFKLWQTIGANRKTLLMALLVALIPFYGCYFHFRGLIQLSWTTKSVETIFDVSAIFVSWFTVITIIAYGQHYLNKPHPWLKHFNEGLYPFYILHQTVIIALGYYIVQLPWSIAAKYWSISFLTLISCIGLYFLVIRPFNVMRFLFGLKPKTKKIDEALPRHPHIEP
ncbi:MAG: acyltransferase family protein [Bacteroidetes bacterium]|nr:acyltransferase family protein [Bacteroidota bacterium]